MKSVSRRLQLFEKANEHTLQEVSSLPKDYSGIRVIELGRIDSRASFHNAVQIYPVGYKCEQVVNSAFNNRGSRQTLITCEIIDVEGDPEFLITIKSTGQLYMATSESAVWKKFDAAYSGASWSPSFFNLEIELLIEGLDKSIQCESYRFHGERGYGELYFHNDQSISAKISYLLKVGREQRNLERQKNKAFSSDNNNAALNIKENLEKNESLRSPVLVSSGDKDETQKRKDAIRESIKLQKDKQRKIELELRGRFKNEEKVVQERLKVEEKMKHQLMKDIRIEIKKLQVEASQHVLDYFDYEEDLLEQAQTFDSRLNCESESISQETAALESTIAALPPVIANVDSVADICTSSVLDICCFLNVFRNYLNLQLPTKLIDFMTVVEELKFSKVEISSSVNPVAVSSGYEVDGTQSPKVNISSEIVSHRSESYFYRIQLCLVNVLRIRLIELFDLCETSSSEVSKREILSTNICFPLNELTWAELTRMVLLHNLLSELGITREETQSAIRGSKQINIKSSIKNVIRYIRYRMTIRLKDTSQNFSTSELDVSENRSNNEILCPIVSRIDIKEIESEDNKSRDLELLNNSTVNFDNHNSTFSAEGDFALHLGKLPFPEYNEAYQRCSKVFMKILNMPQSKHFLWEVDRISYPDYYSTVKSPISLVNVAYSILHKSYGECESTVAQTSIYSLFYRNMRQIFLNCVSYNTENTNLYFHAQKLFVILSRHMERWIYNISCPLAACDELHCIWSYRLISNPITSIKCGRCAGIYLLNKLFEESNSVNSTELMRKRLILPSQELIDLNHDEWYCPLCLLEDTEFSDERHLNSLFYFNEFGASTIIPWMLNIKHSNFAFKIEDEFRYLLPQFEALKILSNRSESSSLNDVNSWSVADRIKVIAALCKNLLTEPLAVEYLQNLSLDCEKLIKLTSKSSFREADFMKTVQDIVGEDGVALARSYLDGIHDNPELDLNRIIVGRCVLCKGSTYEDDSSDVEIILCDGCNAEVHMQCLNLLQVPSCDWFCPSCTERHSKKIGKSDLSSLSAVEFRNKEAEDNLISKFISLKATNVLGNYSQLNEEIEAHCTYCGMTELELCSPLVIGHSYEEHCSFLKQSPMAVASEVIVGINLSKVKFLIEGIEQELPHLSCPYFPLLNSNDGNTLLSAMKSIGLSPFIVHEYCALQMFHARLNRLRHTQRRRRRLIGDRVVTMTGLHTIPLGGDSLGNLYWKFPCSEDLFISIYETVKGSLISHSSEPSYSIDEEFLLSKYQVWKKVSDTLTIQKLVTIFSKVTASNKEKNLKQNIINYVLLERQAEDLHLNLTDHKLGNGSTFGNELTESDGTEGLKVPDGESVLTSSENISKPFENNVDLAVPVQLKLLLDKGQEILKLYEIPAESVFEDVGTHYFDSSYLQHFSFSKNKYFAIAVLNVHGKKIKFTKGAVTVTYQIQKHGIAEPLAVTPLNDQWTDSVFYFSAVVFKLSGLYTISFIIEGNESVSKLAPLVFSVTVNAKSINCGPTHAIDQLIGRKYIESSGRHVSSGRRELIQTVTQYQFRLPESEFEATKIALLTVYAALPYGALILTSSEDTDKNLDFNYSITESLSWNDNLDQVWRGSVESAKTPIILMECVLVLEHFLNKTHLILPYSKLIQSLPLPHFALKCASTSAVALRIFCIDKALAYDKVVNVPRSSRRNGTTGLETNSYNSSAQSSRSSRRIDRTVQVENIENDTELDTLHEGNVRGRRQASYTASSKIKLQSSDQTLPADMDMSNRIKPLSKISKYSGEVLYNSDGFTPEDEEYDRSSNHEYVSKSNQGTWQCVVCTKSNDRKARSCSVCGERKPSIGVLERSISASSAPKSQSFEISYSRLRRVTTRNKKYIIDSDNDDDTEFNFDEDEDEYTKKRGKKKRKVSEYDDGDVDNNVVESDFEYFEFDFQQEIDLLVAQEYISNDDGMKLKYLKVLSKFYDDDRTVAFWDPVDTKLHTTYLDYVSDPMDLGKITRYVLHGYYGEQAHLFAQDVRLVWKNCMAFNSESSELFKVAEQLAVEFDTLFQSVFENI